MERKTDAPVEIELVVHRKTLGDRGAMLVSLDGDAATAVWIPKSQVITEDRDRSGAVARGGDVGAYTAVLTVPAWLAEEKGLDAGARGEGMDDLFGGGL